MSAETIVFGPLAEPPHPDAAGPDDPPWRDNAYLCFWSDSEPVFGHMHVSTSPNAPLTWARFVLYVDGKLLTIDEPVEPGSFASSSIDFDVSGPVTVKHDNVAVQLECTPRFAPHDFCADATLGGLVAAKPLQHFEQGADVTGSIQLDGRTIEFRGRGFRDRTWGFRDETAQWAEWLTVWATFDDFDITALKVLHTDGHTSVAGWVADAAGMHKLTDIGFTFDGAGQLQRTNLVLGGGDTRVVESTGTLGGIWFPVGPDNNSGPALHAYNDYVDVSCGGAEGRALVGYGVVRKLF